MDCDYREGTIDDDSVFSGLDQQGADSPGGFDVPDDARFITQIKITTGVDLTADNIYGWATGLHLEGKGIQIGEGYFPGPCGSISGGTNVSPGVGVGEVQEYYTKIPVNGGSKIKAEGEFYGTDLGALHMMCALVFDGPIQGRIVDCDYRMGAGAAANTLVNMAARGAVTEGDFDLTSGTIVEVLFGAGILAIAGPLRVLPALHLSGTAFVKAGNYKFIGKAGGTQDDIASFGDLKIHACERYPADIRVKKGKIRAQVQMIEDDAGTLNSVCGLAYG